MKYYCKTIKYLKRPATKAGVYWVKVEPWVEKMTKGAVLGTG